MLWAHHHQYLNDNLPSRMAESWWVGWTWTFFDMTDYIQSSLFEAQIIGAVIYSLFDYLIRQRLLQYQKTTEPHQQPINTSALKPHGLLNLDIELL